MYQTLFKDWASDYQPDERDETASLSVAYGPFRIWGMGKLLTGYCRAARNRVMREAGVGIKNLFSGMGIQTRYASGWVIPTFYIKNACIKTGLVVHDLIPPWRYLSRLKL
jgi:hypothetical protein